MTRAALVSMPFGPVNSPSIALGLLQSVAVEATHEVRCFYLNVEFASELGTKPYTTLSDGSPSTIAMAGEWVFSANLLPPSEFLRQADPSLSSNAITAVAPAMNEARALVPMFLERSARLISAYRPSVVGFTSVFQQTCASLALARRLKELTPEVLTVMGGANAEDPMGPTLLAHCPELDAVVSGEGEHAWLDLLDLVSTGTPPGRSSGLHLRGCEPGRIARTSVDLDLLPDPGYEDYFNSPLPADVRNAVRLPFESSRGCWWGAKSHCIFCGLNGSALHFRKKRPERAEAELRRLASRYPIEAVSAVDNIIPWDYFKTLLPALAANPINKPIFYETKSNLGKSEVEALAQAGIDRIQPGIESLSDDVLQLMRKGVTGSQNLLLLRHCRNNGVGVEWNYLWGFPGENPASYEYILGVLPSLHHLEPPSGWGRLRVDRFSPLHAAPEAHGIRNLRAVPSYGLLFPSLSNSDADKLAYYFTAELVAASIDEDLSARLHEGLQNWKAQYGTSALVYAFANDTVLVWDARGRLDQNAFVSFDGLLADAFVMLLDPLSPGLLGERLGVPVAQAQLLISQLVNRRLVVRSGRTCLNVCNEFGAVKLQQPAAERLHTLISTAVAKSWLVTEHATQLAWEDGCFDRELNSLLDLGAANTMHCGRSLFDHLVGVANRLAIARADPDIILAGLFHSVYGSSTVSPLVDGPERRTRLAEIIGERPEKIVYDYHVHSSVGSGSSKRTSDATRLINIANAEDIASYLESGFDISKADEVGAENRMNRSPAPLSAIDELM